MSPWLYDYVPEADDSEFRIAVNQGAKLYDSLPLTYTADISARSRQTLRFIAPNSSHVHVACPNLRPLWLVEFRSRSLSRNFIAWQ